jgi:serine/threonine protein kinase
MLSGRSPFTGEDVASLLYLIVHEEPPSLTATVPGLPPEVEEVLRMALAKEREDRFASVGAFARALESAIYGSDPSYEPTPAPQPMPLSKDTVNYGSAATESDSSIIPPRPYAPMPGKRKLSLTTFSHSTGEFARRLGIPLSPTKRVLAIAGGALLVVLVGAFLLFRSGGPAKEGASGLPIRVPAAAPPPRAVITPTPSLPAAVAPADQPGPKAAEIAPKAKRPKQAGDPSSTTAGPVEDTKTSPKPRPRPKAERRIITDI